MFRPHVEGEMRAVDGQLISAIYEGIVETAELEPAIKALAGRFGCESASIVSFDQAVPRASIAFSVGALDAAAQRRYASEFAAHDPAPAAFAAHPPGTVFASDRLFSRDYLRNSVFLHEFLRPLGIEETLGGTVAARGGRLAFFTMHRGPDRTSFEDDELARIEIALPHLARALELRRSFEQLNIRAGLLTAAIDRLGVGVVVLDAAGTAIHINSAALTAAGRKDGLWFDRKGYPHATSRMAEQALLQHLADVAGGGAGGIVRVTRRDERPPYALLIAPLPSNVDLATLTQGHGTLILIHDPDRRTADMTSAIVTIFGLPKGTARLVAALAQGEETKDYAEKHGLSYETVRHHLKVAFARTGARGQARLLQMVTKALSHLDIRR
jgi:PAS domain-containing protein/DNA-binding CsgD family transcriptional regulator